LINIPTESFREITMGCVPIIQGKTKLLNELYVIRQIHSNRFQNPSPIMAFLLESWHTSYKEMYRIIANEIEIITSTNKSKLDTFVQQGFVNYYSAVIKSIICKKENNSLRKVRTFIREYLPCIAYIYNKYFAKGLPLPKLRNKKSRYYIEFNEISKFLKQYNC